MPVKIPSIDDSKTIRIIVARALRSYDCVLCETTNGEEGVAVATREKPDLILLDITMPVMDGVIMLSHRQSDEVLWRIPVIMLTAESGRENVQYIARLGIRDYIAKPFKEDDLIEKINRVVLLEKKPVVQAAVA
jgi:two-component system cell cycle response regulator